MISYKNVMTTIVALIAGWLTVWTALLNYKPSIPLPSLWEDPDTIMENVYARIFDKQGKLKIKITTPTMLYYGKKDLTELTTPHLTIYREATRPWYVTAERAQAFGGTETIYFSDDVIIHNPGNEQTPATLIKTASLTVFPNKEIAETQDLVTLIQSNLAIAANGLHANMSTGDIQLLANMRGEYAPQ